MGINLSYIYIFIILFLFIFIWFLFSIFLFIFHLLNKYFFSEPDLTRGGSGNVGGEAQQVFCFNINDFKSVLEFLSYIQVYPVLDNNLYPTVSYILFLSSPPSHPSPSPLPPLPYPLFSFSFILLTLIYPTFLFYHYHIGVV